MLLACWSVKGGSGTTVVAVALASVLAQRHGDAVVADLGGDVPAVLGLPDGDGPGLLDWLAAEGDVPADALRRLEVSGRAGVAVLPRGAGDGDHGERADLLAAVLAADPRPVVADCGSTLSGPGVALAATASVSLLVIRPCYLALRRAVAAPVRPSGVVLVGEPGRSLAAADVEDALGVPVQAEVAVDPAVARAVDAGLLPDRLPRRLARALRAAA